MDMIYNPPFSSLLSAQNNIVHVRKSLSRQRIKSEEPLASDIQGAGAVLVAPCKGMVFEVLSGGCNTIHLALTRGASSCWDSATLTVMGQLGWLSATWPSMPLTLGLVGASSFSHLKLTTLL